MTVKCESGLVHVPAVFEKYIAKNVERLSDSQERKANLLGIVKDDWDMLADYGELLEPTLL